MSVKLVHLMLIAISTGCSQQSAGESEANKAEMGTNIELSNLDKREFNGIVGLANFVVSEGASLEIFDENGTEISLKSVDALCKNRNAPTKGFVVVNDNDARVFKRYVIANICGTVITPKKDFGYKNPYQL